MLEMLKDFHFIRPEWFFALPIAALAVYALSRVQREGDQWTRLIRPQLLPFLLEGKPQLEKNNRTPWLFVPLLIALIALAGPSWHKVPQPLDRNTAALVICWDLSPSMLAQDISPSRLERSRLKLIDLLNSRKDGQTALIAYSGQAHVVTPLTEDVNTIINLLPSLNPTNLPSVGSNPEMALQEAQKLLSAGGAQQGDIVFLTDGIDPSAFAALSSTLKQNQHRLTLWAIGTDDGGPIPLPNGGFLKQNDTMVMAKVNHSDMRTFASQHQGLYLAASTTDSDIKRLQQQFDHKKTALVRTQHQHDQWFDAGQYLSLLLLPLCLVLFKRGWLLALIIALPLPSPPVQAQTPPTPPTPAPNTAPSAPEPPSALQKLWLDAWYTPDQQGAKWLQAGRAPLAAVTFNNPQWRAIAEFNSQNYTGAAKAFEQLGDATSLYNAGNAYTHGGQFANAIKAYERALALNPQFSDASHNLAIAKQLKTLAEQQKQANSNQNSSQKDNANNPQQGDQSDGQKTPQDNPNGQPNASHSQSPEGSQASSGSAEPEQASSTPSQEGQATSAGAQANTQAATASANAQNAAAASSAAAPMAVQTPEEEAQAEAKRQAAAQQQADAMKDSATQPDKTSAEGASVSSAPATTEAQQKLDQWLQRVPDDPSGYLQNKFRYQYQQRQQQPNTTQNSSNNPEARW